MLKNYQYFQNQHRLILKSFMVVISLLLLIGISVSPITWKNNPVGMSLHVVLITGIIISLLFFIKKDSNKYKTMFIFFITIYFHLKFWTFPETAIMLSILAITPLIPIFLFDVIGFYIVASLNIILGPIFIYVISQTNLQHIYEYVALDASAIHLILFLFNYY